MSGVRPHRSRRSGRAWPALALVALAGCGTLLGPDHADELSSARDRWAATGAANYQFVLEWRCFCVPTGHVEITVRDGAVTRAVRQETGEEFPLPDPDRWLTIPGLFALIGEAISHDPHELRATYHEELGYPTDVYIDFEENVADEEQGFVVTGLVLEPAG